MLTSALIATMFLAGAPSCRDPFSSPAASKPISPELTIYSVETGEQILGPTQILGAFYDEYEQIGIVLDHSEERAMEVATSDPRFHGHTVLVKVGGETLAEIRNVMGFAGGGLFLQDVGVDFPSRLRAGGLPTIKVNDSRELMTFTDSQREQLRALKGKN